MFLEQNQNGLIYMTSDIIPYPHVFTTRYGGVSTGHLASLNLIGGHGDDPENIRENFQRVTALLGVGVDDCAVTKQVHRNDVRTVELEDRHECLSDIPYEADGIVTATQGLPLFCFTADCVPVLLCDPINSIIGAVHCGWRSSVTDIHMANSVTDIGSYAFAGCTSLTGITMPDSIQDIKFWTFAGCVSLEIIKIPETVVEIGYEAFYACSSLKSIVIPDNIEKIGNFAFRDCTSLTNLKIPPNIPSPGHNTFEGCPVF